MDASSAKKIIQATLRASKAIESITAVVASELDEDEASFYEFGVGVMLADAYERILNPIVSQHPELAPEGFPISEIPQHVRDKQIYPDGG